MITIVDYGMGNLRSVEKAFEHVGATVLVSSDPDRVREAPALILPGVGAFPEAMRRIRERGLDDAIAARVDAGAPLLGICLGMQLLFESSTEHDGGTGLGLLAGTVEPLEAPGLKLPNIGWSPLRLERPSPLTEGIAEGEPVYFVHSLTAHPRRRGADRKCGARSPIRGDRRLRADLRDPVPPREIERGRAPHAPQLRHALRAGRGGGLSS